MNRSAARNWIKRYLGEAVRHKDGLEAALPLSRDQVILEDPESREELYRHPSWSLTPNGTGSVVLAWLDSGDEETIDL